MHLGAIHNESGKSVIGQSDMVATDEVVEGYGIKGIKIEASRVVA